jgi:predicted alpha/beta hydrolase
MVIATCVAQAEEFSLPTTDGKTSISGQIDWPQNATDAARLPAVVLAAGSGLFDRHMLIGDPQEPRSKLFDDLASVLTIAGFAVVRFDYRGVRCNPSDPQVSAGKTAQQRTTLYAQNCIDADIRRTVTPETNRDDFAVVVAHARMHARIDAARLGAIGVSEGTQFVGLMLARDPTAFKAVAIVGPMLESPAATCRWQRTDRVDDALRALGSSPGRVTEDDIRSGHSKSRLQIFPLSQLLPADGAWTTAQLDSLTLERNALADAERTTALAEPDTERYPKTGPIVQASQRWWKQFFTDTTPTIDHFDRFTGPLHLFIGTNDSQIEIGRQKAALAQSALAASPSVRWHAYEDKGHVLGDHALFGPMSESIRDDIVTALKRDIADT